MSRLAAAFERLRGERRVGLITYVTAGDPSLDLTVDILRTLDRAGVDVLEVGVPFSDPLADGPVIQRACERGLAAGATLERVLAVVESARPSVGAPIVLFSYANPLYRMGYERFAARAAAAGVDGVLVLDIPVEESDPVREALLRHDLDPIYLLSPTTTVERARLAGERGRGFLYVISRTGVTGARPELADDLPAMARRVKAVTSLPLAVGFGISTPAHIRALAGIAEAAVVGSALVSVVAEAGASAALLPRVERFIRELRVNAALAGLRH